MTSIAVQTLQSGDASPQAVAPPTMHADATAAAMTNGMYSEQKHVMDVVVASPPTVADVMACDPAAAAGAAAAAEGIVPTTKEAAVRSGSDVVADGIGVKNNMNFVVGGNATAKHLRASVSTPRTGPEDGTSRIPHLSILLKGPAWIALMTIEDAEPEKAVNVYEKIVELKRVVLQPKMKTKASSSSDNNSKPNSANEKLFATRVMSGGTISDDEVKGKNTSGDATAGGMYKSIDGHFGTTVVGGGTTQEGEGEDRSVKRKNVVSVDDSNNVVNTDKNSPSPNTNHAAKQAANNGEDESAHVTTYYNDDLRLHLPEQSLKKKRARRRGPRSKSSGYRGVTCYRRTGRWEAHIWENRRQIHLGSFANPEDAAETYDRAALRFRGIDADLNYDLKHYRDDVILATGASLNNDEFVKLLRAHDKIKGIKPKNEGASVENFDDVCGNHIPGAMYSPMQPGMSEGHHTHLKSAMPRSEKADLEKKMRGFIVKSIKRRPGTAAALSGDAKMPLNNKMEQKIDTSVARPSKSARTSPVMYDTPVAPRIANGIVAAAAHAGVNPVFSDYVVHPNMAMQQQHPHNHHHHHQQHQQHQHIQMAFSHPNNGMDTSGALLQIHPTHGDAAMALPVHSHNGLPMMHVWGVGQLEEAANHNVEFLAVAGDFFASNGADVNMNALANVNEMNHEMAFNYVEGMPLRSNSNNSQPNSKG